jgi:hypothetical protein
MKKNESLERSYFNKAKGMLSLIKGPRRKRPRTNLFRSLKNDNRLRPGKHVSQYYVLQRRRELSKARRITFNQGSALLKELYEEFRNICASQQRKVHDEWNLEKEYQQSKRQK